MKFTFVQSTVTRQMQHLHLTPTSKVVKECALDAMNSK